MKVLTIKRKEMIPQLEERLSVRTFLITTKKLLLKNYRPYLVANHQEAL